MIRYVKLGWIAVSVTVLLVALYLFNGQPNSDIDVFLIWSMLVLSFPSSVVCAFIFTGGAYVLYQTTEMTVATTYLSILFIWAVFFSVGYWQWFVLIPDLVSKFRG